LKLVYRHENRLFVGNAKNILEHEGITTILRNEYASGGVGELSFLDSWPELWVMDDANYDEARKIIAAMSEPKTGNDWVCPACHETNDPSFEICWKCQTEKR
jgi:hypothetical protein